MVVLRGHRRVHRGPAGHAAGALWLDHRSLCAGGGSTATWSCAERRVLATVCRDHAVEVGAGAVVSGDHGVGVTLGPVGLIRGVGCTYGCSGLPWSWAESLVQQHFPMII